MYLADRLETSKLNSCKQYEKWIFSFFSSSYLDIQKSPEHAELLFYYETAVHVVCVFMKLFQQMVTCDWYKAYRLVGMENIKKFS